MHDSIHNFIMKRSRFTRCFRCTFTLKTNNNNSTSTQTTSYSRLTVLMFFQGRVNDINKLHRQASCSECWCPTGCWSELFPKCWSTSTQLSLGFTANSSNRENMLLTSGVRGLNGYKGKSISNNLCWIAPPDKHVQPCHTLRQPL